MTNEELNTALYQKMFAEQETYRKWLREPPPEEILKPPYEYPGGYSPVAGIPRPDGRPDQCSDEIPQPFGGCIP